MDLARVFLHDSEYQDRWLRGSGMVLVLMLAVVGMAWWGTSIMSAACCLTALGMHEGSGHEVFLGGENESVKEETRSLDDS